MKWVSRENNGKMAKGLLAVNLRRASENRREGTVLCCRVSRITEISAIFAKKTEIVQRGDARIQCEKYNEANKH